MKLSLPRSTGFCLLALAAALILPAPAAHAAPMTFFANLSGANETPPTGSPKRGRCACCASCEGRTLAGYPHHLAARRLRHRG